MTEEVSHFAFLWFGKAEPQELFIHFGFSEMDKGKTGNYFGILETQGTHDEVEIQITWRGALCFSAFSPQPPPAIKSSKKEMAHTASSVPKDTAV